MLRVPTVLTCLILAVWVSDAQAQSLQERIQIVKEQRSQAASPQEAAPQPESLEIPRKMGTLIEEAYFDQAPARDVFKWWSTVTDIPLVIDWNGMALDGIDPEQGLSLELKTVPAKLLLDVIMRQVSVEVDLVYEVTPWYVRVMTKRQANRNTVLLVYDVSDMVMTIPNFTNAPRMDLNAALSNTSSGGSTGGGGSSGDLFGNENEEEDDPPTKNEQGMDIADLIRQTIEPEIWQENGGFYASARYYDGRLIVNAPMYVHRQIGMPVVSTFQSRPLGGYKSQAGGTEPPSVGKPFGIQEK